MKIVFLNEKGGLFHGVTGEKLDVINLDEVGGFNLISSFLGLIRYIGIRFAHEAAMGEIRHEAQTARV